MNTSANRLPARETIVGLALACAALLAFERVQAQPNSAKEPSLVVTRSDPAEGSKSYADGAKTRDDAASNKSLAAADYKIAPGDLLEVEVFGVADLKRVVRVSSAGQVTLPLIGSVPVSGMSASDAEALVAVQYGTKYLQDPQISIFVREFTMLRFTMDGAVTKPGIYPLLGQVTLLRALAIAGGGAALADMENVMLFRLQPDGKTQAQKFNVDKMRAGEQADPLLQADDLVVVNRDSRRTAFRDSLFRDIVDALNPFSGTVRNITAP